MPPSVNDSNDIAKQPAKPLRSALRSTDTKVTNNDVPSKSDKNQSITPAPDKSGRKVVDRKHDLEWSGVSGQVGGTAVDSPGGGTTLSDLKRQRAQTRRPTDGSPVAAQSLVVKSTTGSVGNGDVSNADHEPRLRLTAPEFVAVEEKRERSCCVII